jgi:uncharacterized protein YcfJ
MKSLHQEIIMQALSTAAPARLHPLAIAAAASVTVVSLVGAAAILGWLPSSNGSAMQSNSMNAPVQQPMALVSAPVLSPVQMPVAATVQVSAPVQVTATRFQTADGRVFEQVDPAAPRIAPQPVYKAAPAPIVHRKVVHHYVQHTAYQPQYVQQPSYASQHPVRSYVSDMSPVGTGIGAVVGGVLGHQVGGGNGKKLATVAGVLLGGYAGNEVAHDRSPMPFSGR